jgi:hypothetical protein
LVLLENLPSGNAEKLVFAGWANLKEGLCYTAADFRAPNARVIKNNIFGSRRNETLETQYITSKLYQKALGKETKTR